MSTLVTIEVLPAARAIEVFDARGAQVVEVGMRVIEVIEAGRTVINLAGGGGFEHVQAAPSASWIIVHTLGRRPCVAVYLADGEEVITDITSTSTQVNIIFPTPVAGTAILT